MTDEKRRARRRAKQGSVWKRKRNGRVEYVAQYDAPRGEDGKRRRKAVVGRTYAEVVAKLKTLVGDADTGRVAESGQLTVAELVDRYLTARGRAVAPTTLAQYKHTLKKHATPRIGGVRLAHLTPLHVEDFLASMDKDGVGTRARQAAFDLLSRVLAYGEKIDVLQCNPAERVERPQAPRPEVRALSAEQAMQLLTVARDTRPAWVWAAVALALSGLRRGEVFGVVWGDVALERGEVRIRQALKRPAKGKAYIGPPKSKAGRRSVPLPSWPIAALTAPHGAGRGAAAERARVRERGRRRRALLDLRVPRVGAAARGCEAPESVTFHALRHTAATLLLGAGVDVRTAQGIIGHARGSTTLDVYADYIPSNAERAMAGLDAMIASAGTAKGSLIARRSDLVATIWQPRALRTLMRKAPAT